MDQMGWSSFREREGERELRLREDDFLRFKIYLEFCEVWVGGGGRN
jgi:hypothetical protein